VSPPSASSRIFTSGTISLLYNANMMTTLAMNLPMAKATLTFIGSLQNLPHL
jgi:hypothetical protein